VYAARETAYAPRARYARCARLDAHPPAPSCSAQQRWRKIVGTVKIAGRKVLFAQGGIRQGQVPSRRQRLCDAAFFRRAARRSVPPAVGQPRQVTRMYGAEDDVTARLPSRSAIPPCAASRCQRAMPRERSLRRRMILFSRCAAAADYCRDSASASAAAAPHAMPPAACHAARFPDDVLPLISHFAICRERASRLHYHFELLLIFHVMHSHCQ